MGFVGRLSANLRRCFGRWITGATARVEPDSWLEVELYGNWPEQTPAAGSSRALGLTDLLRCMDHAVSDDRIGGVLIRVRGSGGSFAAALSVGRAIRALREGGRRVAVWAESLSDAQYLALCGADRIWLPESGTLFLLGLRTERFFVREFLDKLGAQPDVVHIGRYKSAGDTFTRGSMSDEEREQVESWQADVFDELISAISQGRDLTPDTARDRIDGGPYPASDALAAGLIDGLAYPDEVSHLLEEWMQESPISRPTARRVHRVAAAEYFASTVSDTGPIPLLRDPPRLACLMAVGGVQRGSGQRGISSEGTGRWLEALRKDDSVRGVLLRVDSPGGDALASDLIHREIELLRREKPVVVSMGDVAASGGYYIAAPADAIFAEVGTITGSIGVVGAKLNLEGLYEKLGIAKEAVQHGARAGLFSEAKAFSNDERAALRHEMEAIYSTFIDRVASGRKLTPDEVEPMAQGRIWSGRKAQSLGLVDALGGPIEALGDLARRAGLASDERVPLVMLPPTSRWSVWLRSILSGQSPLARFGRGYRLRVR